MFTRINLYKNCILSARNTEVFRTQAILETYLATLGKPYVADIDITNVYTTLYGTITIDATPLNGDFNYIKFEEFNDNNQVKQTVYAFIDSFRIVNDLLVINYSVDVWHTYFEKCSIRDSLVVRSKELRSGEPYDMPLSYIGKNPPEFQKMPAFDALDRGLTTSGYAIICKIQLFDLTSGGNPSGILFEEYVTYNFLTYNSDDQKTGTANGFNPIQTLSEVSEICDKIQSYQNKKFWGIQNEVNASYARVVKTYIVPAKWLNDIYIFKLQKTDNLLYVDTVDPNFRWFNRFQVGDINDRRLLYWVMSYDLKNTSSFGFFTSQIPYEFDGVTRPIALRTTITSDTLNFYICYNNKVIDITDLFYFEQDYTPTTPDVLAQREIARKQQTIQGICGIVNSVAQMGVGAASMGASSVGSSVINAVSRLEAFNQNSIADKLQNSASLKANSSSASGIVGGLTGLVSSISNIHFANKEKYMTFTTSQNFPDAFINAYYDMCELKLFSVTNESEVLSAEREVGYGVEYFTNSIDIVSQLNPNITHNVIQFGFVRITGLSTEICEAIAKILTDGVKIWYTANV